MEDVYLNLTCDNLEKEHLCCAMADKKHQAGVAAKKQWLRDRFQEGHVFRKLDVKGKVFIEYAPLETAWLPVEGDGFLVIYCLWVSGRFQGNGYAKALLSDCRNDARAQGKAGVCVLSAKKKKPFFSDKKFFVHSGFAVADTAGDYELLSLSFDGSAPRFSEAAKRGTIPERELTIYYSPQCPFTLDSVKQVEAYCAEEGIPLTLCPVDSAKKAREVPCVFENWAVFLDGQFVTTQILNESGLKKILG